MNILVLHGPNLHLLGKRQPEIYGHETLADINTMLDQHAAASPHPVVLKMFQSNHEGELVLHHRGPYRLGRWYSD